jgi:hypothetical protein
MNQPGVAGVGGVEDGSAGGVGLLGEAVVDGRWGHQPDPGVSVLLGVPGEELAAERSGLEDRGEPGRGTRPVLQCLEVRLGVGLSIEVYGLECVVVTPKSESRNATGLERIAEPRSAWVVRWVAEYLLLGERLGDPAARRAARSLGAGRSTRRRSGCRCRGSRTGRSRSMSPGRATSCRSRAEARCRLTQDPCTRR